MPKKGAIETPGWLLTFGDLNSLLLTFFVLLISLSVPNKPKMKQVIISMNNAFGESKETAPDVAKRKMPLHKASEPVNMPVHQPTEFQRKVEEKIRQQRTGQFAQFEKTPEGLRLRLQEALLFDPGSTEMRGTGIAFLASLAPLVRSSDFAVRIEGHADAAPFQSESVPSNVELSALRATSVLRAFQGLGGVDARRLTAVGFGEHRPIAPNDTPENRARNRRVDIYFIETEEEPEVPPRTWSPGSDLELPQRRTR